MGGALLPHLAPASEIQSHRASATRHARSIHFAFGGGRLILLHSPAELFFSLRPCLLGVVIVVALVALVPLDVAFHTHL